MFVQANTDLPPKIQYTIL